MACRPLTTCNGHRLSRCRDLESYPLPNGDHLDVTSVRIYATMNPASVGGGRSQLPRSLRNLFTAVQVGTLPPCLCHLTNWGLIQCSCVYTPCNPLSIYVRAGRQALEC